MLMAETLRANATPLISVMSPRGAAMTRVDSISFAALSVYSAD